MPAPTSAPRKYVLIAAAAAATLVLGVQYLRLLRPAHAREIQAACRGLLPSPSPTLGELPRPALDFTAQDYTGKPVKLSDFRGRVVLVNFWASWCETCEKEKASLEALQRSFSRDELVVLKLASDADWNKVKERFPRGTPLTVVVDPPAEEGETGPIARQYGVSKVPESFLVDREGNVRFYFVNKRDWSSGVVATCLRSVIDES
jgi:peroxiredoxin